MHPERVDIARVVGVVAAVVVAAVVVAAVVGVTTTVRAFGSLLLGHLFPIVEFIVLPFGGRPRAQATVIGIVTPHNLLA
jgi:hypothetical protein